VTAGNDEDDLLRSAALQNAKSILIARRRAEQRRDAYLAEAQRLSHTGSFGWRVSTDEILWSDETFRIFQYDRTTKPTVDLVLQRVHPEDAAAVKQTIERARHDGKAFDHEYRLVMPDSSVKHIRVVAHALSDDSGPVEFVGAVMDVTVAKEAEDKIRLIINAVPGLIWAARPDGRLDFISQRWLDYAGVTFEQKLAQGWGAECHPDDIDRVRREWRAAVAEGKPFETETRVRRFDGECRWFLYRAFPLFDRAGHILGWYGNDVDIHDRKQTEMLLAGGKRVLEMMASGGSRALILEALCHLFEELASDSLTSVLLLDPNGNRLRHGAGPSLPMSYIQAIDGIVIGASAGSCGTAAYRGEPVIVSDIATDPLWADYRDLALSHGLRACWSTPILASDGGVLGTFATYYRETRSPTQQEHNIIDQITNLASIAIEREHAEQKLRQAQTDVAYVSRVITMGELTASLAHEVNQPIAAAVINADTCMRWLAADIPNLEEARACARDMVRDVRRGAEIISRTLLQFKKRAPQRESVDVNEIIREMIILLRSEVVRYSISVRTELAADLPKVLGDCVQLEQVIMNLMINGIDAMKDLDGPRELLIGSRRAESEQLMVAVSDTGVGLPPQQADRIFDAFFTTKRHGTGMGLRISRSLIEGHAGRLWAVNNSKCGASFYFTLPIRTEAPE
jgi:PAS domain S-box-containing protein